MKAHIHLSDTSKLTLQIKINRQSLNVAELYTTACDTYIFPFTTKMWLWKQKHQHQHQSSYANITYLYGLSSKWASRCSGGWCTALLASLSKPHLNFELCIVSSAEKPAIPCSLIIFSPSLSLAHSLSLTVAFLQKNLLLLLLENTKKKSQP